MCLVCSSKMQFEPHERYFHYVRIQSADRRYANHHTAFKINVLMRNHVEKMNHGFARNNDGT